MTRNLSGTIFLASAAVLASFTASPLRANLITNGSFEAVLVPVGSFTDYLNGSTGITGWTVVGGADVGIINGTFSQECCTFPAEDGNQWADLTGTNANSTEGLEQTIATTSGDQYTITFWIGNIYDPGGIFGTTSTVKVLTGGVSGTSLGTFTNSSTTLGTLIWQQFSTTFTATGSTTAIDFINEDPSTDNSDGLDNVSVNLTGTGVPEPGTLWLAGAALVGLGFLRRKG
jgi:hypothetical protein